MSKFRIVLWAAVFLASHAELDAAGQEVSNYTDQLAIVNRAVANRHIDLAIGKINERSAEVYQQVLGFGPQDGKERPAVTTLILNKVSSRLQALQSSAHHYITMGKKKGTFNATECKMYLNDYLRKINERVMTLKSVLPYQVYNDATVWIGELLHSANVRKEKLNELKVAATTCSGFECNNISNAARQIWEGFFENTVNALKFYSTMADGSAVVDKFLYNWNYYTDMGREVLRLVYDCTQNP